VAVFVQGRGAAIRCVPIIRVMLVPVYVLCRIAVLVDVTVTHVCMAVIVRVQFAPARDDDPYAERNERKRRG